MRSGLVQTGAWAAATTAGVVLSWLGVSAVLSDSAFEAPRALPLPVATPAQSATRSAAPTPTPTPTPSPPPTDASPSSDTPKTAPATTPAPRPAATTHAAAPTTASPPRDTATGSTNTPTSTGSTATATTTVAAPDGAAGAVGATTGSVHSYLVPGGRVALDMRPDSAELVSATPDPGWQMQLWNGDQWLRIDFSRDGAANSVFVTWNGHPPDVQTVVR